MRVHVVGQHASIFVADSVIQYEAYMPVQVSLCSMVMGRLP